MYWKNKEIAVVSLIFLITSCAPLFWQNGYASSVFLGYGDYVSPFDSLEKLRQLLFVYDPLTNGGVDQSFNQSFIPYYAAHYLLELISGSSAVATTLILCGILFSAQYGFFLYIKGKIDSTLQWWSAFILSISGGLLYGASPYFISNVFPGHISGLFLISIFPYLIRYFDSYVDSATYRISSSEALRLIFCLVLCAAAFANIGNFVALVMVFGVYTVFKAAMQYDRAIEIFAKFSCFVLGLLLVNAWWMLAFAVDIGGTIQRTQAVIAIGAGLNLAAQYSTVPNIFIGLPEAMFHIPNFLASLGFVDHQDHTGWIYRNFMWGLLGLGIIGLILSEKSRIRWQLPLLGLLLFTAFIAKGPNPPFGDLFMFAWDYVPTFQIFRRPASKIYWAYWFCFISLAVIGTSVSLVWARRYKAKALLTTAVMSVLIGAALFSVFALSRTTLLKGLTPPEYYYSAAQFLKSDGASRILMFPPTEGAPYTMNGRLGKYYGVDFFELMTDTVILKPGNLVSSSSLQAKVSALSEKFVRGGEICGALQELGISHLVFRSDVEMSNKARELYRTSLRIAHMSKDLRLTREFGALTIFSVQPGCLRNAISYDYSSKQSTTTVDVVAQTPTDITFPVPNGIDQINLVIRSDFSNNWMVDVYGAETSPFEITLRKARALLSYLCRCKYFVKDDGARPRMVNDVYAEYGNQWNIQIPAGERKYIVSATYIKQEIFYIGLFISIVFSAVITLSGFSFRSKESGAPIKRNQHNN